MFGKKETLEQWLITKVRRRPVYNENVKMPKVLLVS